MSRHRNVRNMRYEDELSADEYGVSYDDLKNYAISPDTEEMFIYNRAASKDHTLSSFMEEPSLNEEDHEISNGEEDYCCNSTSDFKMPTLDDASQVKLQNGLESLEGILGDNCHRPTAVDALMKFNYDIEKALDDILSKGGRQTLSLEPPSRNKKKDLHKISHSPISLTTVETSSVNITPSLSSITLTKSTVDILKSPLSSVMSTEKRNSNDIASLMEVPLHSIGTRDSTSKHQSENLMKTSLSSLMSGEQSKSNDISGLMKVPLHSLGTTDSMSKHQSENLMKTSLSSLMSGEQSKSNDISGLMKVPLHSLGTTDSMSKCQSDSLMKTSLSSLASVRPMEHNNLNTPVEPSVGTIATPHLSNSALLSNFNTISTSLTPLSSSFIDKSVRNGDDVSAGKLLGTNLRFAASQANAGPFFTAAKGSALSDLTVASSEYPSSPTRSVSLRELAKCDKPLHGFGSVDLTDKASQKDTLSVPNGLSSKLTFLTKDEPGMVRKNDISVPVTPIMNGIGQIRNRDVSGSTSMKEVRTSLKELSLESSLKGFLSKTADSTVSENTNSRLNKNGRDVKSSRKQLESSLNGYKKHFGDASNSGHVDGRLESEFTMLTNRLDHVGKTTTTVGKRVLKRKPSSFGRALSSLHEPDAKIPRRNLLYDDGNGFSLPLRVDLRGLLHTGDGLGLRVFTFSTPSRDDAVVQKQRSAFQTKKKRSSILDSSQANSSSVPPIRERYRAEAAELRVC